MVICGPVLPSDANVWASFPPLPLYDAVNVVVVRRPGAALDRADPALAGRMQFVETPFVEISSTDVRGRVREGRSIRYLVPGEVEDYIYEHGLFRKL